MRILFFGTPVVGHVVPMLPLAEAARTAGHETALITDASMASVAAPLAVLPAGPTSTTLWEEAVRRIGGVDPEQPWKVAVEFFFSTRVDLSFDEALEQARTFAPDLIVAEIADVLGPMVAAALGVAWASHGLSQVMAAPLQQMFDDATTEQFAKRDLKPAVRLAYVDPLPDLMQVPGTHLPADRISLRPSAYDQPDSDWTPPIFPSRQDRPRVLVTLGTSVDDPALLTKLTAVAETADVNLIITLGAGAEVETLDADRTRVHPVSFVPLARLLDGIDVVVSTGGTGTLLATLAAGLPMVLMPIHADQPWNAERAAQLGFAVAISDPDEAGQAVRMILSTPSYRTEAEATAAVIRQMPAPSEALRTLIERC